MEMEMQRLNPGMMARYEIAAHRPAGVNAIEFGMSEAMLGTVNRMLDETDLGVACVAAGEDGFVDRLNAQSGMYTILIRGYVGEEPVRREQVVQCVLSAHESGDLDMLSRRADIAFGIVDDTDAARALAARFIDMRRSAGLDGVPLLCLGGFVDGAECHPLLTDSLAFRSEADEAARQCAEMNYLDDMLYVAEPYARITLDAPEAVRHLLPGEWFGDVALARQLQSELFDGGLFLMAAAGWLNGCDTLADCMNHPRLRRFVGEGFTQELIPAMGDVEKSIVDRYVIDSFERYVNPLNRNRVLRAAGNLLSRFTKGPLRALRRLNDENFEPPRRLSFALASTIMLYAGARKNPETGLYEVARGRTVETVHDDPALLEIFSTLSHDMPPESLAYAALADRELWGGLDLREIDGLEARVALDLAAIQRQPDFLPEAMG